MVLDAVGCAVMVLVVVSSPLRLGGGGWFHVYHGYVLDCWGRCCLDTFVA